MKMSSPQFGANSHSGVGAGQLPPSSCRPGLDVTVTAPRAQVRDYTDRDTPMCSTAAALADLFDIAPRAASVRSGGRPSVVDTHGTTIPVGDQAFTGGEAESEENVWDDYYMPRMDPQTSAKKRGEEVWICPEHGPTCTPGICMARGRVESADRWRKEQEARQKAGRERQEEKERRRARKGAQETSDESESGEDDTPYDQGVILIATERTNDLTLTTEFLYDQVHVTRALSPILPLTHQHRAQTGQHTQISISSPAR